MCMTAKSYFTPANLFGGDHAMDRVDAVLQYSHLFGTQELSNHANLQAYPRNSAS